MPWRTDHTQIPAEGINETIVTYDTRETIVTYDTRETIVTYDTRETIVTYQQQSAGHYILSFFPY